MSNVETFDLRRPRSRTPNYSTPPTPTRTSDFPEIRTVRNSGRRSSSKNSRRRRRHKSSSEPRCREPNCEICRILREDTWVSPVKPVEEANAKDENVDRFPLTRVGLNPDVYKFERKASQLDATINLLSQVLDERLQAERYRDASEISQIIRDLVDKRQRADRLLVERRSNLVDLSKAQELKNEYDGLIFNAIDMGRIGKHLTTQQYNTISSLKHA